MKLIHRETGVKGIFINTAFTREGKVTVIATEDKRLFAAPPSEFDLIE